jgi:hypothetical protein
VPAPEFPAGAEDEKGVNIYSSSDSGDRKKIQAGEEFRATRRGVYSPLIPLNKDALRIVSGAAGGAV